MTAMIHGDRHLCKAQGPQSSESVKSCEGQATRSMLPITICTGSYPKLKVQLAKVHLALNLQLDICGNMLSCACCPTTSRTISSSAFTWRNLEPSSKRFEDANPHTRPKLPTVHAASFETAVSLIGAPVASIDVEFAHFLSTGKVITAAAEVCLLKDTGAVLLHSYICPGTLVCSIVSY